MEGSQKSERRRQVSKGAERKTNAEGGQETKDLFAHLPRFSRYSSTWETPCHIQMFREEEAGKGNANHGGARAGAEMG